MEETQDLILRTLDEQGTIEDSRSLVLPTGASRDDALAALSSLKSRDMITFTTHKREFHVLTAEGEQIAREGSHEARLWNVLPVKGQGQPLSMKDLQQKLGADSASIGHRNAFKNKWIVKDGDGFVKLVSSIQDTTKDLLLEVESSGTLAAGKKALDELQKRKLITIKKDQWYTVEKGPEFSVSVIKMETDLTAEMLASGSWKTASFKKYNFDALGAPTMGGALHPLLNFREEVRNIFLEMGFAEMPTASFVESSFWCFDALFVPQQHPARDLQDTFYLSDPSTSLPPPKSYYDAVAKVHEHGGYGSIGYRAPWSDEDASKLILRTHTTATSSHLLREIATQKGGFKPAKLFSIDRVFRNESTDATHLAEFHQVEGVVADKNLTLGDLIGFMKTFFAKMGLDNLRFKPAYNPYTEPSMEIFAYHSASGKWLEIGNSGMFRPEMLEPMGFPKDIHVLGWGLSLERPTMIKYKYKDIRTLVGHRVNIKQVAEAFAVRL
ncbi:hypothetical protein SCHPADRAFT_870474 [Schizopora paradoxa]|uniref:phenylalanine--tRNA ligase n=1 Tax=Schizopora paradoxa TaxID=27342 RepID=A0A0H2SFM2_9AGAM|nr:hypothetical protein SCHPADRAFT_870474 [Schizopora paradoxa]